MCKLERFVFAEGALADEFGESAGESGARGVRGKPETFFRAKRVIERESVGAEHHFVRIKREQLLQDLLELRGVEQFGLKRSIEINVFDGGEERGFAFVRPASVEQHEDVVLVTRIAKNVFEIENMALTQAEIIANADSRVEVHGKLEPGGSIDDDTENVVLKDAVVFGG